MTKSTAKKETGLQREKRLRKVDQGTIATLRAEIETLQAQQTARSANEAETDDALLDRLKDAQALLVEANGRIEQLEGNLERALAGRDHAQGADLPDVPEGKTRYFTDLNPIYGGYLERIAAKEGRTPSNMLERILRIDYSLSPDKGGAVVLGPETGTSMPRADAPKIPLT